MRTITLDMVLAEQQFAAAGRSIEHWHRLLVGDGLGPSELAFAALQLRKALLARETWGKMRVRVCRG
jgi:hypothetical protein